MNFLRLKTIKSKMKWFDGVWSRFKPEIGQDRGVTSVDKKNYLLEKKLLIYKNFNIHKTLVKILKIKEKCFENQPMIGLLRNY